MIIIGYILFNEETEFPVTNELTGEIKVYHNTELALIDANKSVTKVSVKKVELKILI